MNGSSNKTIRPASSPAAAGFRPVGAALAIAAAFLSTTDRADAQPSGAHAIHGQASLSQQGSKLVVTTQNGAGTNHSAVNWQSFSVPSGSTTHFQQPGTTSLSINRVVGNDPSAIFGTLSSNGRLVLVNPAGIAVGAGAVVDTAGFTASTLRMSDANALAGRLVFGGDGMASGALDVNGQIVARSGDVVLIAPNVQVGSQALVQSPNGATVLAAGQKVELTGRGLEGIRLELQAPGDQALNLGTLQGGAVGIFAGQLKHSGLIQATGIGVEGGKVVLKGLETADISGQVTASKGDKGGQVHATASKVMLRSGAVIDVGGEKGGGEALVGGGWQGKDSRISNSVETLVEAGATINADATVSGDGGTVVAWSDGSTRVYGALSARGGEVSGNGGNVETSGHYLDMQGTVDTRAPNGEMGNLLLDPTNIYIAVSQTSATVAGMLGVDNTADSSNPPIKAASGATADSLLTTGVLQTLLSTSSVTVTTDNAGGTGAGFIKVVDSISWTSANQLTLNADTDILVDAAITSSGTGPLSLRAKGNIAQTAAITTPGLLAISDFNAVTLNHSGNAVGTLSGYAGAGRNFSFTNSGALDIGTVAGSFGVSASGAVDIRAIGALTVMESLTGSGVVLQANGGLSDLNINAAVNAGSGSMALQATKDIVLSGAALSGSGTGVLNAGSMARVAGGTTTLLNTSLSGSPLVVQGTLDVGANVAVDSLSLVSSGAIMGSGDLTIGSSLGWSGGSMAGSGNTIIGAGAVADVTGAVSLMRPMGNAAGGTIRLSSSGIITAMAPASLDNSGFFEIQNDGGFSGSGGFTFNNSGTFIKSAGTGVGAMGGVSFTNTGVVDVASGTLQFDSGGFSSNSGLVYLAAGATLDTSNSTLASTSAGVIKGSGTLRLGGGTLNNSGAIMPGGPGIVGTLTIDAATVNLDAGTTIHADVVSTSSFDVLNVTGNVNLASGVTVVPDTAAATGLLPGDSFDIIQSSLGSVGGTLPVVTGFGITLATSPLPAVRVALALPPAPAPAPATGSMVDQATAVLGGDQALAQEVIGELSSNPLITFATLLEKEEEQVADGTGADNVVDNNQCRR